MRPFARSYDMLVHRGDSTIAIGARDVSLAATVYAGNPAWLIVDTHTASTVAVTESLYVSPQLRPLHWAASQGLARMAAEFVGDSVYGAVSTPVSRQNLVMAGAPDIVPDAAFAEVLLQAVPLATAWSDSATVVLIDAASHTLAPAQFAVVSEEELASDSTTAARPVWVVTLRSDSAHIFFWVDKSDGSVLRVLQQLPAHDGSAIEFRRREPPSISIPPD